MNGLRIAILTHSTNPRGGVVHALELGEALTRLGHVAVVHAPDPKGQGFFRPAACETACLQAAPAPEQVIDLVAARRQEYGQHFRRAPNRDFDIFHAQDSISANALADLKAEGGPAFARTVHHLDDFADARLMALQARGVVAADRHFTVSREGQRRLRRGFNVQADIVGNGVDTARFSAVEDAQDAPLRLRLGLGPGPVLLSVGGIEERKNSLRLLQAFQIIRNQHSAAQLVIAGGATLLDHAGYRQEFMHRLAAMNLPEEAVRITGPLPQNAMPALYRAAGALVFPSCREGFGLAVLEAMASGVPVVASRIAPFTEYLDEGDVAWCEPQDCDSIAQAILRALDLKQRGGFIARGFAVAARHDWQRTAIAHLATYSDLRRLRNA